ncbi:MAG TPA: hypothetical protein VH592_02270, partial [Gemmataceae bacterium]
MTSLTRFFLIVPLFLAIVVGCASKSQTPCSVSGKVTYKGQTVTGGTISFSRTQEELSGSYGFSIKRDGTYEGSSLPAEEYVVVIETESINPDRPAKTYQPRGMRTQGGKKIDANTYKQKMQEMGKMPGVKEEQGTYVKIPKQYGDKKTSPL